MILNIASKKAGLYGQLECNNFLSCDGVSHALRHAEVVGLTENRKSLLCNLPKEEVGRC